MKRLLVLLLLVSATSASAQLYFPPLSGTTWETDTPESIGWDSARLDSLFNYLNQTNSKAFIVLKDGRIVVERYFDSFVRDSVWYWASAGKSLTALLVGIAQEEGFIDINQPASLYMGSGWTSTPLAKENLITVRAQLTMTSGLNDAVSDQDCWLPPCLNYLADAGTRWAYHNGPYTLLDSVIERATSTTLNSFHFTRVRQKTGMTGGYLRSGPYNNVMFSNARSFARFGLLILNRGVWGATTVLGDTSYFRQMTSRSQTLNRAYGYLWWLNGSTSYMVPQLQLVIPGMYAPDAPHDMISAIGRDGQICSIIPSQNLVIIRMGENPGASVLVPTQYVNDIWKRINYVANLPVSAEDDLASQSLPARVYPNPFVEALTVETESPTAPQLELYSAAGQLVRRAQAARLETAELAAGCYHLVIRQGGRVGTHTVVKL